MPVEISLGLGLKGRRRYDAPPDLVPVSNAVLTLSPKEVGERETLGITNALLVFNGSTIGETASDLILVTPATATFAGQTVGEIQIEKIAVTPALPALTGSNIVDTTTAPQEFISFVAATTGTNTATAPTHQSGDLILVWAYTDASATPPTMPSGWTEARQVISGSNAGRCAYKFAASASETIGTWTGATSLIAAVYRGVDTTNPIGNTNSATGATGVYWPATAASISDGTSWFVAMAGVNTGDTSLETPPTGTARASVSDATDEAVLFDTNGGVAAWGDAAKTVGGTANAYATAVVELHKRLGDVVPITRATLTLAGQDVTPPAAPSLTLRTTPLSSSSNGQVIEYLDIQVSSGTPGSTNALTISHSNVTVRYCKIGVHRTLRYGIHVTGSGVTIEDCEVYVIDPPTGLTPFPDEDHRNINISFAPGFTVRRCRLRDGSANIFCEGSSNSLVEYCEGYNARGPFPKGQMLQTNNSGNVTIRYCYSKNELTNSYTEDNFNFGNNSLGIVMHDCLIDGNNSPSGQGVIFEGGSSGTVTDVDTIRMGNGSFCQAFGLTDGVTFTRCRGFDNYYQDYGRGLPMSTACIFGAYNGVYFIDCSFARPAVPGNEAQYVQYMHGAVFTRNDALQPRSKASVVNLSFFWD